MSLPAGSIHLVWLSVMLIAMSDAAMATEATTGPAVWVVPDGVKINPATAQPYNHAVRHQDYRRSNPVWQDGQVRLYAARGETVAFQIVIRAADRPIRQVDVSTEPLRAADGKQIGNDRYAAFREWFITVKTPATSSYGPGDYPEPLIPARAPRHGLPLTVPPHRCEVLWIDLTVPRDAAAATYRGLVRLTASGKSLAKLPVELTVWDIVLPLAPSQVFDTPIYMGQIARQADPARRGAGPVSTWSPRMKALVRSIIEQAHQHRMNVYCYDAFPDIDGTGQHIRLKWDAFDELFGPYLDGSGFPDGVPLSHFCLFVRERWPTPKDQRGSRAYEAAWISALKQARQHFQQKGWTRTLFHLYVHEVDEVQLDRLEDIKYFSRLTRAAGIPYRQDIVNPQPPEKYFQVVGPLCDMLNVCARDIYADIFTPQFVSRYKAVWVYQSHAPGAIGNFNIDAPAIDWRIWPWVAFRYNLTGCHDWSVDYWTENIWTDPANWPRDQRARNGCGLHFYPGDFVHLPDQVVGTIRNKLIRRGQYDIDYLYLLRQAGQADLARSLAAKIVRHAGHDGLTHARKVGSFVAGDWQYDPAAFLAVRQQMARALLAAEQPG